MTATVKFVGSFRSIAGRNEFQPKLRSSVPLRKLVEKIVKELPKLKSVLIDQERGEPKTNMLVLVNGQEISVLKGMDTIVNDGDEVVFVPVLHGG